MHALLALWLAVMPAKAMDLEPVFGDAARAHEVPEGILKALAWEASRWKPELTSAWGGYGLFDFREPGEGGVDLERAARLIGRSPDDIRADPALQVEAAAALLRRAPELWARGGEPPAVDDLAAWWGPVRAFSGHHAPNLQVLYADHILKTVSVGVPMDPASGLWIRAELAITTPTLPPPMPNGCDYAGCDQFMAADASNYSNYARGPDDIDLVVIHTVQGSYSGCISWFQNPVADVSAHYVVRSSDGAVTQMVGEDDVAWHAGNWDHNLRSVGIEHEGYVEEPATWYTDEMYAGSGALTADIIDRNGISFDRNHIIGHNEVPGATHTDPGSGWDWDLYMAAIDGSWSGGGGGAALGNFVVVVADEEIYTGAPLPGATVWIEETGEVGTTDGDGYYRFYDLPLETFTVRACHDGYLEGSCVKSLAIGDNWCSIALVAGDEPCAAPDSGGEGGWVFSAEDPPTGLVADESRCGCATAQPPGAGLGLLGLLFLGWRRRRGDA